jgi:hypothetical protein
LAPVPRDQIHAADFTSPVPGDTSFPSARPTTKCRALSQAATISTARPSRSRIFSVRRSAYVHGCTRPATGSISQLERWRRANSRRSMPPGSPDGPRPVSSPGVGHWAGWDGTGAVFPAPVSHLPTFVLSGTERHFPNPIPLFRAGTAICPRQPARASSSPPTSPSAGPAAEAFLTPSGPNT